jgi:hypothetical protein
VVKSAFGCYRASGGMLDRGTFTMTGGATQPVVGDDIGIKRACF